MHPRIVTEVELGRAKLRGTPLAHGGSLGGRHPQRAVVIAAQGHARGGALLRIPFARRECRHGARMAAASLLARHMHLYHVENAVNVSCRGIRKHSPRDPFAGESEGCRHMSVRCWMSIRNAAVMHVGCRPWNPGPSSRVPSFRAGAADAYGIDD